MKENKAKIFMVSSLIILIITIIVSSTYAYYVWTTSDSEVTKIVAEVGYATVTFDGGSDINANLKPVPDKSQGIIKAIKVKADTTGFNFNLYLDIINIDTGLKDISFRYELYKSTTKVKEGNFSDTYLNSNTTTCSKNNTKHITLLSNESISTSNTTYTLYIWIDGANYENPSTMMDKTFSFKLHADGEGAIVKTPTTADTIIELYANASKTTITNNSVTYNTAPSVSLMNDRLGGTTTSLDGGNIRYYGASPNNYIYFNCSDYSNQTSSTCETWRIIGVFDGKLKIIRNESIGNLAWDQDKNEDSAKKTYDNDWTTATLQKLLNESYYNRSGTITYYSGSSGRTATSLDMTKIGIKNDTTRNLISEVTWNLGGWNDAQIYSNQIYGYERETTVYSERPTTWAGKIGLMYPSDYAYATDLSKCKPTLYSYNASDCVSNDWLFNSTTQWTLTHNSRYSHNVWYVLAAGRMLYRDTSDAYGVRPALYLSEKPIIVSGDGSSTNPYQLAV